jgi:hypothetical protein
MSNATLAIFKLPKILNEANLHYKVNSVEKINLKNELTKMSNESPYYVPAFINSQSVPSSSRF